MSIDVIELTTQELDALVARIDSALKDGLSLEPDDIRLILHILQHFALMQVRLANNDVMKHKYLKLMGLISTSETQQSLFNDNNAEKSQPRKRKKPKVNPPVKRHPATVCHHKLEGFTKGQSCPECKKGRLYKYDPASFIRIVGSPPLSAERHVMEQWRCNVCGHLFTATLPDEVLKDGVRQQKYGYSARALMAINKFYMGSPYYRQERLQTLLGVAVTASSVFDQCALLVDTLMPIVQQLKALAANAVHYHIDDTGNRILDQQPIEKANRRGKGTRTRCGIYTSGMIATLASGTQVVLFQTNIGHAGEWIDEVLTARDRTLATPLVMSDALPSNQPTQVDCELSRVLTVALRNF